MLTYPHIDPIIFSFGPLRVGWYGVMYIVGYALAIIQMKRFIKLKYLHLTEELLETLVLYIFIGMVLGARTFYVFIYNWTYYSENPWELFQIWKGGLSFHGAFCGILIAIAIFKNKYHKRFFHITDFLACSVPIGLFFGRIGNFINGELYGRVTDSPLGMIFPGGGPLPRHPSQIYQGLTEGILLWIILNSVFHFFKPREGVLSTIFLGGYAIFRFFIEFFREPDAQLGYMPLGLTMGQYLNLLQFLAAIGLLIWVIFKAPKLVPAESSSKGSKRNANKAAL